LTNDLTKLILDKLSNSPKTADDVMAVFNDVKVLIAHYLVNQLPTLEAKFETLGKMLLETEARCLPIFSKKK
jgi:hypothetical protein